MLTYDIIIKHLMPIINTFSLQPGIAMKSTDFPFFRNLFDESFYRIGVKSNSFISSISYCINNEISDKSITDIVKQLNINIIIFDFMNNKIMSEYSMPYFNPWKPTVFLANYDEWWEPIVCKDTKLFSFSSPKSNILKNNILNQHITKMDGDNININDNFLEIIELEGFKKQPVSNEVSSEISSDEADNYNNAFVKEKLEKPNKTQLNKMKKDELIELCKQFNKNINISKPTKKDLIDIFLQ